MRICLYTMHSMAIEEMARITVPNKSEYCCRNEYSFIQEPFTGRIHSFPGYERIPCLIDLLTSNMFDWVFWLGCDALITNLGIKLESIIDNSYGMIVATDGNELQMDSFLIQANKGGQKLLERVWDERNKNHGPYFEQSNLIAQIAKPEFSGVVKYVPQRTLNSMQYDLYPDYYGNPNFAKKVDCFGNDGEWHKGDFVFHIPGRPMNTKIDAIKSRINLIA